MVNSVSNNNVNSYLTTLLNLKYVCIILKCTIIHKKFDTNFVKGKIT